MSKENKLTPNFSPIPHTVTEVKEGDVKVRNDLTGKEYRRNVVQLKKVDGSWKIMNGKDIISQSSIPEGGTDNSEQMTE